MNNINLDGGKASGTPPYFERQLDQLEWSNW